MKGLSTFFTLFAFYFAAHSEVVQLDNSNFDQVFIMHVSMCAFLIIFVQFVNGDKDAFVEFYAPCK